MLKVGDKVLNHYSDDYPDSVWVGTGVVVAVHGEGIRLLDDDPRNWNTTVKMDSGIVGTFPSEVLEVINE